MTFPDSILSQQKALYWIRALHRVHWLGTTNHHGHTSMAIASACVQVLISESSKS